MLHAYEYASVMGDQRINMYCYDTREKAEKAMVEWKQAHGLGCCNIGEFPLNPAITPPVVTPDEVQAYQRRRM